ncbi:hypothetical protein [Roseovarius dicentrarchi]|uniref:hypothetical protein n=1 Tax=Roseovarius dicentrarchi TaxID=2250573 RepID=UPI000DEAB155|nr:hypothetical protein [Roseovarius dicentrarchi]
MDAYKKEIKSTIGFGLGFVLLGHTGLWFIILGTDNSSRILGLPTHYFIALILGSLGVLIWSIIWCRYANRLEDDIEAENAKISASAAASAKQPGSMAGATTPGGASK